jgi:hypothetical protein
MSARVTGTTYRPPSIGVRIASSAMTMLAAAVVGIASAFVAVLVLGAVALVAMLLTGHGFDGITFSNPGTPDAVAPDGLPTRPPWPTWVAPAVVLPSLVVGALMAVLGAARFGHGTVGDGITGLETTVAGYGTPTRTTVVARVAVVLAVGVVVALAGSPGWAFLALTVLWLPALAPSRRTVVDLALGLHPFVPREPKLGRAFGTPAPTSD